MSKKNNSYRKKIVKQLYFNKTLSCAELSSKIKRSFPLTTRMIDELIQEKYVVESGYAPSSGGRRPIMYSLSPGILYIVSVAMDQFITRIAIVNMENKIISPVEKFELPLHDNAEALNTLSKRINKLISKSGIPKAKIIGIGIGMPGFVDVKKGINYTFLKADGKTITEYIQEKVKVPVFIDNDSSLIALAELRFGAAQGKKNAMVVNIGWGVGLGLILNEELFRGHNGFAGEFSHIPLFLNGKLCSCGKFGCLETETSLLHIIEKAQDGLKSGRQSILKSPSLLHYEEANEAIIAATLKGDTFAVELFSEAGYNIGRGVSILIHLLNPEMIILGGRGSIAGKIWLAPIQQALNEHCIPRLASNTVIAMSTLGYEAELIGAASLVMESYAKEEIVIESIEPGYVSIN